MLPVLASTDAGGCAEPSELPLDAYDEAYELWHEVDEQDQPEG